MGEFNALHSSFSVRIREYLCDTWKLGSTPRQRVLEVYEIEFFCQITTTWQHWQSTILHQPPTILQPFSHRLTVCQPLKCRSINGFTWTRKLGSTASLKNQYFPPPSIYPEVYTLYIWPCLVQLRYSLGTRERPFTGVLSRYKQMHGLMDFPSSGRLRKKIQPLDRGVEHCPQSLLWLVGGFHHQRKRKASHKREIEGLDSQQWAWATSTRLFAYSARLWRHDGQHFSCWTLSNMAQIVHWGHHLTWATNGVNKGLESGGLRNRLVYYISNYPAHHYFPPLSTDVSLACLHTYAYLITCITPYVVFSTSCSTRGIYLLYLYDLYEFDLRSLTKGYRRQTLRY